MEQDLVSVIVTVYNVEKYVRKCVESIINQTYRNFYRKNYESVCHKCNYFIIDNYKKVFDYYEKLFKSTDIDFFDDYNYFVYRQVRNIVERYIFNKQNKKSQKELKKRNERFLELSYLRICC